MDQGIKQKRERNPRETASIFSLLFFLFTTNIFRKGFARELQKEDIYEVLNSCKANKLGDKIEDLWEVEKHKTKPWIFRPLFREFGWEWAAGGLVLCVSKTILMFIKLTSLGRIVAYFSKNQTEITKDTAYVYALLLIGSIITYTTILHNYMLFIQHLTMKIRIGCSSLIYRKCLKLNSSSLNEMTSGKVVTLLTKDVHALDFAFNFVHSWWIAMVQIVVTTYIMYDQMGVFPVIGVSVLILLIPMHVILGRIVSKLRLKTSAKTDARVRVTQEILSAIRIIKMYTWERFFTKEVNRVRMQEINHLRTIYYIKALTLSIGDFSIRVAIYICIITYLAAGNYLSAEKAYVVIGCFDSLRSVVTILLPFGISQVADAVASLQRITKFLNSGEVPETQNFHNKSATQNVQIRLKNVSAAPDSETSGFSLEINPGLTAITGPVGCGKSTLIKLILQDIPMAKGSVLTDGSISYASQQPWLFPSSVKQNILFGEPLDEQRYQTVIKVCALQNDLETFPHGDNTIITDQGLNLSGGQKTRINLARAVYKVADIYLLDDTLSSVDASVAQYIFRECVQGLLKHKLCIFVTHQVQFLKYVDDIILLTKGVVKHRGNYKNIMQCNGIDLLAESSTTNTFSKHLIASTNILNDDEDVDESSKLLTKKANIGNNQTVYDESKQHGGIRKQVYRDFLKYGGVSMILTLFVLYILAQAFSSLFDYFVSYWVDLEENLPSQTLYSTLINGTEYKEASKTFHPRILLQFSLLVFASTIFIMTRAFLFFIFCTKASMNIHNAIVYRILNASMVFFDSNLSGNIINRLSRDLGIIDDLLPNVGFECARIVMLLGGVLVVVSTVNPTFLIPSACFGIILFQSRIYYLRSGRSLKRLEGSTRSPVIGHISATMEGLTTIRASKVQNILIREFDKYQDTFNSTMYMQISTARAFGFYLDSLCSIYIFVIVVSFITFCTDTDGGKVGLAVTQALTLTNALQWGGRHCVEFETQMTSVERALEYTQVETEDKSGDKPENWPSAGKVEYKDVSLRYAKSGERILKDINFTIESQEKIGVVGRTGSGKSSIISVLFKLYEFEGCVTVDGVDINTIDMDWLRSNIAIIPQDHLLFTGTLRNNLDPNKKSTDTELWGALEEVEMKKVITSLESGIDTYISEGGSSFSIGERQLLCLARAILSKSKIVILDEATANIDPQTDFLIQRAIRKNFLNCTVITIAHRLHTIMDSDKVLVMDTGRVVEYDNPTELLKNVNGCFYGMTAQAGLLK